MFVSDKPSTPREAPAHRRAEHCRSGNALHCVVLAEARALQLAQPRGMMRALKAAGCHVTLLQPDDGLLEIENSRWLEGVDVVVARGRSTSLLARLSAAEAAGVPTLNQRSAIAAVADKANMVTRLRGAGIATPRAWIGGIEQLRRKIPSTAFPLVLKPVQDNAAPALAVDTPAGLAQAAWSEPCVIAQQRLPDDAPKVTLYAIGERMWALRRPGAFDSASAAVVAPSLPRAWRDLAARCGELFGLQLFGVDCIETGGELQVIDVNDLPDYDSVPEANLLLARHVTRHASRRARAAQTKQSHSWLAWPRFVFQAGPHSMSLALQKDLT